MLKLTKTKSTAWLGNGFGYDKAEWILKDHPHIEVTHTGLYWKAFDNSGDKSKQIADAYKKTDLLRILEEHVLT